MISLVTNKPLPDQPKPLHILLHKVGLTRVHVGTWQTMLRIIHYQLSIDQAGGWSAAASLSWQWCCSVAHDIKGKGFPYSTPSVGPGADPGVQAVSLQVTLSHPTSGRLPLLSARPAVTSPAAEHHHPLAGTKLYCLVTEAKTTCLRLLHSDASSRIWTRDLLIASPNALRVAPPRRP